MKTTQQLGELVALHLAQPLKVRDVVFVSLNRGSNDYARNLFEYLFRDHVEVTKDFVKFNGDALVVYFTTVERYPSDFIGRCDHIVIDHYVHEVGGRMYPSWVASMDILNGRRNAK